MSATVRNVSQKFGSVYTSLKSISCSRNYFTYTNEPSQPIQGKSPKWVSAEEAFQDLKSGDTVFAQGAAATPISLLNAMTTVGKSKNLQNVTVCHMHTEGPAPYTDPSCEGIFRPLENLNSVFQGERPPSIKPVESSQSLLQEEPSTPTKPVASSNLLFQEDPSTSTESFSFFMGGNMRKAVAEGRGDALPIFLSEIPLLFTKKIIQPDIAVIHVSPPDQHGYCSLGTSVDCVRAGMSHSKIIVAQINPNMPRTFGDGIIHISHIDYAVKVDTPLPVHGGKPPTEIETKIGKNIAENLVEDGATLQMGIGSIPDAVLAALINHKDLGIHSEMFAGGVVDLVNRGCVTNGKKIIHKGRIVGSFLNGTQELYDFVDNNPFVEMLVVDYVNNTGIIARQPKMTAINSCIEVDLTGQISSDSIGTRMYSGFGGQVDFIRGAAEGFDGKGKPIIALPSTTNKGDSKIAPTLKPGAGVVTTRAHAHYVVTEHGIAYLFGKSIRQRAYELIKIAHPDHRESLEKAAFERLKVMPSP